MTDTENNADLRGDLPEDLEMVRRLYEELGLGERTVGYREVLAYVRAHSALAAINAGVKSKSYGLNRHAAVFSSRARISISRGTPLSLEMLEPPEPQPVG